MNPLECRIGTRKSLLAKAQAEWVRDQLEAKGVRCTLYEVESEGDKNLTLPLYQIDSDGPGIFTKHLEKALLADTVDIAVHSLKDLPTDQPADLFVIAVPKREVSGDWLLIGPSALDPNESFSLKKNAIIGTSSLRREAQWKSKRSDVIVTSIRGNVPTRINAVRTGKVDAVVLAAAGLTRLKSDLTGVHKIQLSHTEFVSAPGQGALAIETRKSIAPELKKILEGLNDEVAETETNVERQILKGLHGGCTLPLGVRCSFSSGNNEWTVNAFLGIATDRTTSSRVWKKFESVSFVSKDPNVLVKKTVSHFEGVMHG